MQLRRFTADSTPAALGAVRLALGDDAIILANRRLGDQVEIIATGQMDVTSSIADIVPHEPGGVSQSTQEPLVEQDRITDVPVTEVSHAKVEETIEPRAFDEPEDMGIAALTKDIDSVEIEVTPIELQSSASTATERVRASAAPESARSRADDSSFPDAGSASLLAALETQSLQIEQLSRTLEVNLWGSNSPNRSIHLRRLFALGIGAELAVRLVERVDPATSAEEALRQSLALLKSTLPIGTDKTLSVPGVTVMSGLAGAGKTTALVKLATQHVKQAGNQSIIIVCADTHRIGAFEELQSYGRLLGVPTVHAHDAAELDSLLSAFTHKQLVLVDHTLPNADDAVELPERLLNSESDDSVRQLFVLPATLQSSAADALISRHCVGRSIKVVLTHLDSNARLGELFNPIIRHHIPIAYWSDGPSVQVPLQKADASVLVATAVAMSRRIARSPDDEWLQRLIQPSHQLLPAPLLSGSVTGVQAI